MDTTPAPAATAAIPPPPQPRDGTGIDVVAPTSRSARFWNVLKKFFKSIWKALLIALLVAGLGIAGYRLWPHITGAAQSLPKSLTSFVSDRPSPAVQSTTAVSNASPAAVVISGNTLGGAPIVQTGNGTQIVVNGGNVLGAGDFSALSLTNRPVQRNEPAPVVDALPGVTLPDGYIEIGPKDTQKTLKKGQCALVVRVEGQTDFRINPDPSPWCRKVLEIHRGTFIQNIGEDRTFDIMRLY
jgi:hypothetical protein